MSIGSGLGTPTPKKACECRECKKLFFVAGRVHAYCSAACVAKVRYRLKKQRIIRARMTSPEAKGQSNDR